MMLRYIVSKIFSNRDNKIIHSFSDILDKINRFEKIVNILSDIQLRQKTLEFQNKIKKGYSIKSILPEAFAVLRETGKRVLGERHYDVQIMGALILSEGMIAEMKTGEGKTLVASLIAYLHALTKKGVHIITVNDYLAKRDSAWMGKIYKFHGLSVGCLVSGTPEEERKNLYRCDIVYGTNNEFSFDYLKDNLKHDIQSMVQRELNFAIIDEVDSILIDEARTPLVISGPLLSNVGLHKAMNSIVSLLHQNEYELDEKSKTALLTDVGSERCETLLKDIKIIRKDSNLYDIENMNAVHYLNQAIRAHKLFKLNIDYIVKIGRVLIIDEFTGRIVDGKRYSEGLHQAIEAKEKVLIHDESQTLASITFQNYFRMYPKMSGMTATAMTEAQEFLSIYNLEVVQVPTNNFVKRIDECDSVYQTENAKNNAIISHVGKLYKIGQPVLIGTISIEKSELISNLLTKKGIVHKVLNAKFHEQEAEIIALAGQIKAITIATNMAGRGTDIKLGGNINVVIKKQLKMQNPESVEVQAIKQRIKFDRKKILDMGGLFVIGTERHDSRRIDNQLRGRAGRQGDPGKTKFFLSLEDNLMRIFGSTRIAHFLSKMGLGDEAIEHPWINRALAKAQQKVESRNYEIRKNLLKFDDVMNEQSKVVYNQRIQIMQESRFDDILMEKVYAHNRYLINKFIPKKLYIEEWMIKEMLYEIYSIYNINFLINDNCDRGTIIKILDERTRGIFRIKQDKIGIKFFNKALKTIFIVILDQLWKDHLYLLDRLKVGINLRAYGQKNPLNEYKLEGFKLFEKMFFTLDKMIIHTCLKIM